MSRHAAFSRVPKPALSLLTFMMAVGPFGDTEYTPALPAIAHSLHADYGMVQFTMTAYLLGSAVSQLGYGPFSDRYGRRPLMLCGSVILVAGSLLCMLSFSIWPLIVGRLVQGVGACAGGVIADAAVRDAFDADHRQGIYAKINAAFALAPAIGPVAGTYVQRLPFGWHSNFALLLLLSCVLLFLVWKFLPETKIHRNRHAIEPGRLWSNYWRTLKTRDFSLYAVLGGCCIGVVYSALIGAPDLVINVLHRGSEAIVIVALVILVAFVIGAGSCAYLSNRVSHLWIVGAGFAIMLLGSAALLWIGIYHAGQNATLAWFLAPIGTAFIGVGLTVPVTTARALGPFNRTAGTASSMLGFTRMGVAALGTIAMGLLPFGSVVDMPIVFLFLSALAVTVFVVYLAVFGTGGRGKPAAE